MPEKTTAPRGVCGVQLHHPLSFWMGALAILIGTASHMPGAFRERSMGHDGGMAIEGTMLLAMLLVFAGLGLATFGLIPRYLLVRSQGILCLRHDFRVMDEARMGPAHFALLTVLAIALVIDVMKPATLGFVVPGLRAEYGLTTTQAAALPLVALTGTTIGSLLWGYLADRIGRRACILLASLFFMATAVCGLMPTFGWNLLMCFLMGTSAGGMLPIVYALMSESIPARQRGWLVVLHGGVGMTGGYLVAAGLAALLEPRYGWRVLWFAGLPTGALMILLNRWIPESPRFLLERGQQQEAYSVMTRFCVAQHPPEPIVVDAKGALSSGNEGANSATLGTIFRYPYLTQTLTVATYGVAWGVVNWGFVTLLPTMITDAGGKETASGMLSLSALIAIPGTAIVAWLYGRWSSRRTMVLYATVTVAVLLTFAVLDPQSSSRLTLTLLVVLLLVGSGGIIAMLSPYTAEIFPTHLRGIGSGFAAGSSKVAGIFGPLVVAWVLARFPGFTAASLLVAAPMAFAAVVLARHGVETGSRSLEEIETRIRDARRRTANTLNRRDLR